MTQLTLPYPPSPGDRLTLAALAAVDLTPAWFYWALRERTANRPLPHRPAGWTADQIALIEQHAR